MYNFRVVKRNGRLQEFDKTKIKNAILQSMKLGSGIYKPAIADAIADEIESYYVEKFKDKINPYMQNNIEISDIETHVLKSLLLKSKSLQLKHMKDIEQSKNSNVNTLLLIKISRA